MTPGQTLHQFASAVERPRECEPSFTLERHIASLRDSDPEKWARLNLEWEIGRG